MRYGPHVTMPRLVRLLALVKSVNDAERSRPAEIIARMRKIHVIG